MLQAVLYNIEETLIRWQKDDYHTRLIQRALGKLRQDFLSDKVIPALVAPTMAWRALRGKDLPALYVLNTAHFLFYAFLDLTDDAEDHDLEGVLWQQLGSSLAVNTGSSLLFLSLLSLDLLKSHPPFDQKMEPLRTLFIQSGWHLTVGQHRDLASSRYPDQSAKEVLKTHALKTGSSVKLYLESAALLANASPGQQMALADLGASMGVMGQILGDWHNLQKSFSSDLANHCQSLPLALLRPVLTTDDQEIFQVAYDQAPQDQAAHTIVRHLLQKYQIAEKVNRCLEQYAQAAWAKISDLQKLNCQTAELEQFLKRFLPV